MTGGFKTILVPVDFSINTEVAIAKASEIIDMENALIILLYVDETYSLTRLHRAEVSNKLEHWKLSIEAGKPGLSAEWIIEQSESVQDCIAETAKKIAVDLIVIGKTSRPGWFRRSGNVVPIKLAKRTGIPVLMAKPGALHTKIKTVVVPITVDDAKSKMAAIEVLCKQGILNIHLVTFQEGNAAVPFLASALLRMYQWIKASIRCPVEYALLDGGNKPKALLTYAEKVNADILLVYPDVETWIDIWNRHISDVIPSSSKVQVLAVQP